MNVVTLTKIVMFRQATANTVELDMFLSGHRISGKHLNASFTLDFQKMKCSCDRMLSGPANQVAYLLSYTNY